MITKVKTYAELTDRMVADFLEDQDRQETARWGKPCRQARFSTIAWFHVEDSYDGRKNKAAKSALRRLEKSPLLKVDRKTTKFFDVIVALKGE